MKISNNFIVQEFIPKKIYDIHGNLSKRYINEKLVNIAEIIRAFYKKAVIINNYHIGGEHDNRALRLPGDPYYKLTSDHSHWLAFDFEVEGVQSLQVQKDIIKNQALNENLVDAGATGIEINTIGWTHLTVSDLSLWSIPEKNGIKLISVVKK
jgi:hypothetical protein